MAFKKYYNFVFSLENASIEDPPFNNKLRLGWVSEMISLIPTMFLHLEFPFQA